MDKVYSVIVQSEYAGLECGIETATVALFANKEIADSVCEHLKEELKEKSFEEYFDGKYTWYVDPTGYLSERYYTKEENVYCSVDSYYKERKAVESRSDIAECW